jgi:UDP-glucose 4-epimerase
MDFIFHMAAIVGQKKVLTHPVEVLSTNIKSTERLLESVAKGKKGARILLASSSCVYDALPAHVHKEESVDLSMHSGQYLQQTYPLSKLVGEVMGLAFEAHRQVDCIMARLFNVIGPGQTGRYGMVVPTLLRQALHQEPMTIYGDGKQTRSFCYVEDIVRMLHHLMQNPKSRGQIVNVGSQEELSIASLAHLIKETLKSSSKVVYIPYEEAYKVPFEDVKRRCPDLTKLTSLIGPFQATSLDETLQKMLEKPGEL